MSKPDPDAGGRASGLPWSRPRHESLLLVLVAAAVLSPVYVVSSQDISRLCLTRSLAAGHLTIGRCAGREVDRSRFAGRIYSDKAPGMSVLALPVVEAVGLPAPSGWRFGRDARVWAIRVLTSGPAFVVLALAVGRVSEGLSPGTGAPALVTVSLATLLGAFAATTFGHVAAGAFGFGAFLCAWRRRPAQAGLLAGAAVCVEYQTAIVAVVLALYLAPHGPRSLLRYAAGLLPGALLLGVYDSVAFGSPFHLSYRYVANRYAADQASGFFGISLPHRHSVDLVLFGDRGLLVVTPVVLVALAGLGLLARRHRMEALVCASIFFGFLLLNLGYFLPYGGVSPGPRFLVPALPFLMVGLGPAFARRPRLSTLLALGSWVASTGVALTWSWESVAGYRQTIWGELARLVAGGRSRLGRNLASNILNWTGLSRSAAAIVVVACGGLAFAIALRPLLRARAAPTVERKKVGASGIERGASRV